MQIFELSVLENELEALKSTRYKYFKVFFRYFLLKTKGSAIRVGISVLFGLIMFTIGLNVALNSITSKLIAVVLIPTIAWCFVEYVLTPWLSQRKLEEYSEEINKITTLLFNLEIFMLCNNALDEHLRKIGANSNQPMNLTEEAGG